MALATPVEIKQTASGYCYAACIQSLDNTWGGSITQNDLYAAGMLTDNASIVRYTAGTASLSAIKTAIDNGSYCIVHMNGYGHWVVAYAASGTTAASIDVMDPYTGTLTDLGKVMKTQKADTIDTVRIAYQKT